VIIHSKGFASSKDNFDLGGLVRPNQS